MTRIVAEITMSLDGFVTGPDPGLDNGLGTGGEPLHIWAVDSTDEVDAEVLRRSTEGTGAVVMGRRLFDIIDGPNGWNEEMGYGAGHAALPPVFVVTHRAPGSWRLGPRFRFVDGVVGAVEQARAAAGGKDVVIMGGASVIAQALDGGLADELRLHLAPLVLGAGTPLFSGGSRCELTQRSVEVSPNATHLTYSVG